MKPLYRMSSVIALLSLSAVGQRDFSMRTGTFALGMTEADIVHQLGKPIRPSGPYVRHTRTNEYQLRLDYERDDSVSRLHPVLRVYRVDIEIDRPQPVTALLADIPEAADLCSTGCSLLGVVTDYNFNYDPHIIAYASHPTQQQSELATLIGTNWRPETAKDEWVPAVVLKWKTPYDAHYSYPPVDWMTQKIESVTFTAIAPSIEKLRGTHRPRLEHFPDHPTVDLRTLTTTPQ